MEHEGKIGVGEIGGKSSKIEGGGRREKGEKRGEGRGRGGKVDEEPAGAFVICPEYMADLHCHKAVFHLISGGP